MRTQDSSPQGFTGFDGQVLFAASGDRGTLPYITNGTQQGTRLLSDTALSAANFTVVGDLAFFTAFNSATGTELYCTDGTTAGTHLVADLNPGSASSTITAMTTFAGQLFFIANGSLWHSNGAAAGTSRVWPTSSGSDAFIFSNWNLAVFHNELYFAVGDLPSGNELRAVNAHGDVRLVANFAPDAGSGASFQLTAATSQLFFRTNGGSGSELFVTDGTTAGTHQVADLRPGTSGSSPHILGAFGNKVFFTANPAAQQTYNLYVSDGTAAGTISLGVAFGTLDVAPGLYSIFGQGLAFAFSDSTAGSEPWTSDGTVAGTRRLADLRPGTSGSSPGNFGSVNGQAFFRASTPHGNDWWISDGSAAGTTLFGHDYSPSAPAVLGGGRIIAFQSPHAGLEPAAVNATSPTSDEVTLLADLRTAPAPITADRFMRAGAYVYFRVDNTTLWRTDGTAVNTIPLNVGFDFGKAAPDGRLFFVSGATLYATDGTVSGTQQLTTFPGSVFDFSLLGNQVIAAIEVSSGHWNLYASDQTPSTATFLADMGTQIHQAIATSQVNGRVLIAVTTIEYPRLWETDGTPAGTSIINFDGEYGGGFGAIGVTSTAAYFVSYDQLGLPDSLVRSDGTDAGTSALMTLPGGGYGGSAIFNDQLIAMVSNGLYRSTATGLEQFADIPGPMATYNVALARAAATNDELYFIASDGTGSQQTAYAGLWKTDGTSSGTALVSSIFYASGGKIPLSGVDSPQRVTASDDDVYFDAAGQVYSSDGTAAGTGIEPGGANTMYATQTAVTRAALDDAVITYQASGQYPLVRIAPQTLGSIAGRAFVDADGDGQVDPGESGLVARVIYLDQNHNGQLDAGEPQQVTDAAGQYRFGALPPGSYSVRLLLDAGEVSTTPLADVLVTSGQAATNVDLGSRVNDVTPPTLLQDEFLFEHSPLQVQLRFNEDLGALHVGSIHLTNLTTGTTVPLTSGDFTINNDWNRLELRKSPAALADGNYRMDISAGAVEDTAGIALAAGGTFDFFILSGDANRDRSVDTSDFNALAANFGGMGKTFSQADFNYDGVVDTLDFNILAGQFGTSLPPPAASVQSPVAIQATPVFSSRPIGEGELPFQLPTDGEKDHAPGA